MLTPTGSRRRLEDRAGEQVMARGSRPCPNAGVRPRRRITFSLTFSGARGPCRTASLPSPRAHHSVGGSRCPRMTARRTGASFLNESCPKARTDSIHGSAMEAPAAFRMCVVSASFSYSTPLRRFDRPMGRNCRLVAIIRAPDSGPSAPDPQPSSIGGWSEASPPGQRVAQSLAEGPLTSFRRFSAARRGP
jgi:hypothetical protein